MTTPELPEPSEREALLSILVPAMNASIADKHAAVMDAVRFLRALQPSPSPVVRDLDVHQVSAPVEISSCATCGHPVESGGERRQLEIAVRDAFLAQLAASGSDEQRSTESTEPDCAPSGTRTAK